MRYRLLRNLPGGYDAGMEFDAELIELNIIGPPKSHDEGNTTTTHKTRRFPPDQFPSWFEPIYELKDILSAAQSCVQEVLNDRDWHIGDALPKPNYAFEADRERVTTQRNEIITSRLLAVLALAKKSK